MIIYLDTETTGLNPGEIVQLSYILENKSGVKTKNFFFAVPYVDPFAVAVHGFSAERLKVLSDGKVFSDHADEIEKDFLSADVVISHNVSFDEAFLRAEFNRVGKILPIKNSFCSMKKSVPICKLSRAHNSGYKYPKLSELCDYFCVTEFDIKRETEKLFNFDCGFHDARFDTAALYLAVKTGIESEEAFKELKKYL